MKSQDIRIIPDEKMVVYPESNQTKIIVSTFGMKGDPGNEGVTVEIPFFFFGPVPGTSTIFRTKISNAIELDVLNCYCQSENLLDDNIVLDIFNVDGLIGTITINSDSNVGIFNFNTNTITPGVLEIVTNNTENLEGLAITIVGSR